MLEDNDPMDNYRYLLCVCTGHRRGASTSSQVNMCVPFTGVPVAKQLVYPFKEDKNNLSNNWDVSIAILSPN